jgi:hypothetical protein
MSLTFDFIINPIIILVAMIGAAMVGFGLGRIRLAKSRHKIMQLENEMMSSHAEILELEKAYVALESQLKDQPIPVIPMKTSSNKDHSKEATRRDFKGGDAKR